MSLLRRPPANRSGPARPAERPRVMVDRPDVLVDEPVLVGRPDVMVSDEQLEVTVDATRLGELATATLMAEGVGAGVELSLTFVDEVAMAALNAEHMGESGPTDVLAFPLEDPNEDRPAGMVALLGDVVICPAVAARYAVEHGRTVDQELSLLVVHGLLHVLGHDHAEPDEADRMRHQEQAHLRAFADPGTNL